MALRNQSITASVSSLNTKGNGLALYTDETGRTHPLEIPFALPDETVKATGWKRVKTRMRCLLDEVITPCASRIAPRCAHFGDCGGCRWQQMEYADQLVQKQKFVHESFASIADNADLFLPIIGAENKWRYRNKMEFTFSQDKEGARYLGLIKDSSNGKVLNIEQCHLVNEWYSEALHFIRKWWEQTELCAYHPFSNKGALRTLTLREAVASGDRLLLLTVSGNPDYALTTAQLDLLVDICVKHLSPKEKGRLSVFLRIQQTAKGVPTSFYEMCLFGEEHIREDLHISLAPDSAPRTFQFAISPTAFFQPNPYQAQLLYSKVIQLAELTKDDIVYDLYCGTGTMGIFASKIAKQVVGVEISPESALDAKRNAELNNAGNVAVISGAVRHLLSSIIEEKLYPLPSVIFIDPPRAGLDPNAHQGLMQLCCKKIVYVSCNFITLAEDCKKFLEQGYKIRVIQPIDLFPHTPHVETIVVFEKE